MPDTFIVRYPVRDLEAENARLLGIIARAVELMDNCEYGQARRVLRTGADTTVKAVSDVLAGRIHSL